MLNWHTFVVIALFALVLIAYRIERQLSRIATDLYLHRRRRSKTVADEARDDAEGEAQMRRDARLGR